MPELPEVETIKKDLKEKICNKKIIAVHILSPETIRGDKYVFKKKLPGTKVVNIKRRGKLLIFHLNKNDLYMLLHLRMTGQLIYQINKEIIAGGHSNRKDNFNLPNKHTRVWFLFSDGGKLFFNDLRRFGYVELVSEKEKEKVLINFGPEPLTPQFNQKYLQPIIAKRKVSIKALLLNQKIIAGIGNIYADEVLFLAGIIPWRSANSLSKDEIKKLIIAIKKVLKKAIQFRGTTFNDYVDAFGRQGKFLHHLYVYQQTGKKCRKCKKEIIQKTKVAGRGTHYCQVCQK